MTATVTSKAHPNVLFRDMVRSVMESGTAKLLLHLKIVAYHDDRLCEGSTLPLELLDLKQVLMPRQCFLTKLDPKGEGPRLTRPCRAGDDGQEDSRHL